MLNLYLMSYIHFQLACIEHQADQELMLFRRFMVRVGEQLAMRTGAQALVTGDNLAQVASQTLPNLVSASRAVAIPIFRPLLGYDKNEIVRLAQKIGTYETSLLPYQDCCSLIARRPKTSSRSERLAAEEGRLVNDYDRLIDETLADGMMLSFRCGKKINSQSMKL